MPVIFANNGVENRGRAQVLDRPGAAPMSIITVPDWGGFTEFKSIITNVIIAEQGNYQFLHTLGNEIFLYVFGDRIGSFGLSGISFYDNCGAANDNKIGITHILDYYRKHRVSAQSGPLLITIQPGNVFRTYLLGFRGQVIDPARRMFQFSLQLALVPEENE